MENILYLSYSGSIEGGAENCLYHLVTRIDRKKYNPIVVCRSEGSMVDKLRATQIPTYVIPLPPWRRLKSVPFRRKAVKRLITLARQHQIKLVHANNLWINHYAWKLKQRMGLPVVCHLRDIIRTEQVHKYVLDCADIIIAISDFAAIPLKEAGISYSKICKMYNSVDISKFSCNASKENVLKRDFSLNGLLVGIVGRLEPGKRQEYFIRAAAKVIQHRQERNTDSDESESVNVNFLIIGDEPPPDQKRKNSGFYVRELKKLIAELDIADYVVFTGFRTDIPDVMASLDVLVSASGGTVMVEAMAAGKPVVGAKVADPPEVIDDGVTGFSIPARDPEAMAEAVLQLLEDEQLRLKMGEAGRERAEKYFSLTESARRTEALYEQLIN